MRPPNTTVMLTDVDETAFLIVHGVRFLRVEHASPRARFVLDDRDGLVPGLRRRFVSSPELRRVLFARRMLVRAVAAARVSPSGLITNTEMLAASEHALVEAIARRQALDAPGVVLPVRL